MADYLDGPDEHRHDTYLDCYRNDPSIEATEAAATLAAAIDHWLCGPFDDGDEGQEYLLTRAVGRAARTSRSWRTSCTSCCGRRARVCIGSNPAHPEDDEYAWYARPVSKRGRGVFEAVEFHA